MRRSLTLSLCAFILVACSMSSAHADEIDITLEFSGGTWSLYAEVITTGGIDGSLGLASIRTLIDNVDFGTDGDAVIIASGIGAMSPVGTSHDLRPPVIQKSGGTLDILYGQDISTTGTIVGGVGVGGRDLIASGTYSEVFPDFGTDGALSSGLFLSSITPGGGNAVDPNAINLLVMHGDEFGDCGLSGDANSDNAVTGSDLLSVGANFGNVGTIVPHLDGDANHDGAVTGSDLLDVGANFGNVCPFPSAVNAVPEPSSVFLLAFFAGIAAAARRSNPKKVPGFFYAIH